MKQDNAWTFFNDVPCVIKSSLITPYDEIQYQCSLWESNINKINIVLNTTYTWLLIFGGHPFTFQPSSMHDFHPYQCPIYSFSYIRNCVFLLEICISEGGNVAETLC